ncbi:HNH endonuclease [Aliivibrio salmonicida]|uniref:HNH endonuclease family protein n=1 Tax=Aliivibrio salmonicida TaxID=40269 RepID=UPI0002DFC126|nr:HNH endonuclease family protein [Aliivibrio salmonicida]AZL86835.1 HNH endonuclease [Aliivibrio salmonicida]
MLNTYLYYKLATNPKSRLDKELLSIFNKEGTGSLQILKEISDFSESYINILTEDNKCIYCLSYLKHRIYWVSILSTASFVDYRDINKLKELLVSFYYQNWIAGATVARIKQTSFNIIKLVKLGNPISDIYAEMQNGLVKYSTTKTFKEEINSEFVYGRKWDRAVLLLIEYFSSEDCKQNYINIDSKLHLEHILPQKPSHDWNEVFNDVERAYWTNSLANLTLLSMRKNIQAKNYSFTKKVEAYKNKDNVISPFLITQDVIKCSKWDVEELNIRKDRLLSKIMNKLDVF